MSSIQDKLREWFAPSGKAPRATASEPSETTARGKIEQNSVRSPCPLCSAPIDPSNIEWQCPVCAQVNRHASILQNCGRCKFGPKLLPCPTCHKPFELMLLLGKYTGRSMKVVPFDALQNTTQQTYTLRDFDIRLMGGLTTEQVAALGTQAIESIFNTEFRFPLPVEQWVINTLCKDSEGVSWLHGWLYESKESAKESEPAGQLSARWPHACGKGAEMIVTDVLIDDAAIVSAAPTANSAAVADKEHPVRIALREVEPFNVPPVDNREAAQFMRRLTGGETFEWSGRRPPRSMMLYFLKYNYPGHSSARGWLFSMPIDDLVRICNAHSGTMEDILKTHGVGSITIEYGGDISGVRVTASRTET